MVAPGVEFRAAATNRWNRERLKVVFVDGAGDEYSALRKQIEVAAKQWESFANIRFDFQGVGRKNSNGDLVDRDIDIAIQLESEQFFRKRTYQSACGPDAHSKTRATPPAPSMWLIFPLDTKADEIRRITLHEFGHALGLIHENKRPDVPIQWNRRAVLDYYKFTGWNDEKIEEQVIEPFDGPIIASSSFDVTSIMIYPIPRGLANVQAEWAKSLSPIDKLFIGAMYPFFEIAPPRTIELGVELPVTIAQEGEILSFSFSVPKNGQYKVSATGAPVLIGLMGSSSLGLLKHPASAQGDPASFIVDLKSDAKSTRVDLRSDAKKAEVSTPGTYYLYLRHAEGRTGKGSLRVQVSQVIPST